MQLENLTIRRVCLHEIYKRADDRTIVAPSFSSELLDLGDQGLSVFRSRVVQAYRSDAKCLEMNISRHNERSVASLGAALVTANDRRFVQQSQTFATLLSEAQTSRGYPGGLVVVFDGTVGHPERRFFAVMKAEMQEAFLKGENLSATFVDSVFLSPKTKLYKIGLFVAQDDPPRIPPDGWRAIVYDTQLTATERDGAAAYFHEIFLGLVFPENAAQHTRQFYTKTRDFIAATNVSEETKVGLYNSLYTYLKVDRSPTLQVGRFAGQYMDDALADEYRAHMRREHFPATAILKDISEIAGRMRTRKLRFGNQIMLSGPSQAIADFVDVEAIEGPRGELWTRLTVHDRLESQQ